MGDSRGWIVIAERAAPVGELVDIWSPVYGTRLAEQRPRGWLTFTRQGLESVPRDCFTHWRPRPEPPVVDEEPKPWERAFAADMEELREKVVKLESSVSVHMIALDKIASRLAALERENR